MYCVYGTSVVVFDLIGTCKLPELDGTTDITTELLLLIAEIKETICKLQKICSVGNNMSKTNLAT